MDVLVHNSVVFALLAEKRLGPKPYAMFFDGRIEEFILAGPLKHTDLSHPEIIRMVAERLATFHSLDMPLCKKPRWMFSVIKRWISEIQNNFSGHSTKEKVDDNSHDTILKLQAIDMQKECDNLMDIVSQVDSPVVFCHNDLQEGNILYDPTQREPSKEMTIIDWEYGNYNYRGFDLGNHFCEWAIGYFDDSFVMEPQRYPSREQQYSFFRHYLKAWGQEVVTEEDLRKMYTEVNTFALASHFLWATWATIQGHSSSIEFCYWDYAVGRFEQYFKLKEALPTMLKTDLWSAKPAFNRQWLKSALSHQHLEEKKKVFGVTENEWAAVFFLHYLAFLYNVFMTYVAKRGGIDSIMEFLQDVCCSWDVTRKVPLKGDFGLFWPPIFWRVFHPDALYY